MRKLLVLGLLWLQLALVLFIWWQGSGELLTSGDSANIYLALGRLSGFLLALFVLMQFFIMSRAPFLEQVFGLDKLSRWHHVIGKYLIVPLVAHPLFLTLAYMRFNETSYLAQYMDFLNWHDVAKAVIAYWLLLFVIIYSIFMVWRKWNFERWYYAHLAVYVAIILAFGHQVEVGSDLSGGGWQYYYWVGLYAVVAALLAGYRFALPILNFFKHRFVVEKVVQETGDVSSIYITGRHMEEFRFSAGQFVIVRFWDQARKWQAHPFSLSQSYNGKNLRLSIKASGDYSAAVGQVSPGTKVVIEGPYGVFTKHRLQGKKVVLIAGGIGITPIRSMLEDMKGQGFSGVLFYANKSESDIALRGEVESIASKSNFPIHHVLSSPSSRGSLQESSNAGSSKSTQESLDSRLHGNDNSGNTMHNGFVTADLLKSLVPNVQEWEVFLCGPPPMMKAVQKALVQIGVEKKKIYTERFSL